MIPRGLYWRHSGFSSVQVGFASAGTCRGPATCWLFLVSQEPQGAKTPLPQANTESLGTQHEEGGSSEKLCAGGGGGG